MQLGTDFVVTSLGHLDQRVKCSAHPSSEAYKKVVYARGGTREVSEFRYAASLCPVCMTKLRSGDLSPLAWKQPEVTA